jgi:hypothetical protein
MLRKGFAPIALLCHQISETAVIVGDVALRIGVFRIEQEELAGLVSSAELKQAESDSCCPMPVQRLMRSRTTKTRASFSSPPRKL